MTKQTDALDAVNAIECLKGTSDYTPETFGAFIWPHREKIRAALQSHDALVEALEGFLDYHSTMIGDEDIRKPIQEKAEQALKQARGE